MDQSEKQSVKDESLLSKVFNYDLTMMKEHLHTPKDEKTVQRVIQDYYNQTKKEANLTKEDSKCRYSGVKKKLGCRYTPLSPYTQKTSIVEDKFAGRESLTRTTHVTPCTPDEFLDNAKNRTPLSPLSGNTLRATSRGKLIENNAHCKPKQWSKENWYAQNSNIKQPVFHPYGSGSVPQISEQGKPKLLKRKSTTNTSTKKGKSTANNIPPPSEDSLKAKRNRMEQYPGTTFFFLDLKGPPLDIRRRTNPPRPTYIPPTPHEENYMTLTPNYRNETRNKGKKAIEYTTDMPYSLNLISDFETDDIDENDVVSDNEFDDDINLEWNELQKIDGKGKQPTYIVPRTLDFSENERQGNSADYQPDIDMLSDQSDGDSEKEDIVDDVAYEDFENLPRNVVKEYATLGAPNVQCSQCHAWMWKEERVNKSVVRGTPVFSLCCAKGQMIHPIVQL
ncbi:hypothetical protein POM88_054257 [Heracleum sosnowskyi]|uniref:Uncharacterized protein n=1 Tax=Heracleum sosnowskyi TaxID=360622 RepID=A0AAD8LV13_9APIA|nr:hypothetical protein POM88_054257 [Heracleum sosnowskyi]